MKNKKTYFTKIRKILAIILAIINTITAIPFISAEITAKASTIYSENELDDILGVVYGRYRFNIAGGSDINYDYSYNLGWVPR